MGRGVYASRPGAASQRFKELLEHLPDFRMLAPVCHHRLHVPELRAAIVPGSVESVREHAIFREQRRDRVGELDFAPGAGLELRQVMEYARGQDVPPDHGETGWRRLRFGLLDDSHHALDVPGGGSPSIRSSARITAKTSSFTAGCAHSTACPRPSGSGCLM